MDASTRPDEDTLRNPSTHASPEVQRALAALNRANEIASGAERADPLAGFDKVNATRGEIEDKLHNLSAMVTVIRQAKPDCNTWNHAEWDIDLAMQGLKWEIALRDTIDRDRKRGFRLHPILHRMHMNEVMAWASGALGVSRRQQRLDDDETRDERHLREANPDLPVIKSANSDLSRPGIPIPFRPVFRFEAGHHSEMKPAT